MLPAGQGEAGHSQEKGKFEATSQKTSENFAFCVFFSLSESPGETGQEKARIKGFVPQLRGRL